MSDTNGAADPAAAKKLLAAPTRSYRPAAAWGVWGIAAAAMDGKPWFTWYDIPRMLRDPRVQFLERMWRSPFQRVQFKVHAEDRRVQLYAGRTIRKFWTGSLPEILARYFRFGFAPGGAEFSPLRRRVVLDRVRRVEPTDARPLEWAAGARKGQAAGFHARGVGRVLTPHAFWFAGYKEVSPWFDRPPIAGLFEPWVEKRGRNGAIDSRRRWFRKNATSGGVFRHPSGTSEYGSEENPQVRDNADVARELGEMCDDGAALTLINDPHPDPAMAGKYAWDREQPVSRGDIAGLREYPKDLDDEMNQAIGIPREVFEAAEVGSGWSGRMIPLMSWLGGVDELVGLIVQAFYPVLRYAVTANYGASAWFEVEPESLWKQVQQQAQAGKGGGEGDNPVPGLLGGKGGDDEPKKPKKLGGGWEPYKRRDGGRGIRNRQTHQYREMSGSGGVPRSVRRAVRRLLAERDLADGRAGGQHAPKGGVTIGGTEYPGGRFIPGEVIEKATPAERAALDGKGAGAGKPEPLPRKAVALAGRVLAKGAKAAGKAEHVLVNATLAAHARLPAGLRGVVAAAFRLSMAGFDAGQAAAAAAALDRGVAPEHVAKVGHLLAIADVAMFKATKAAALLGIPGGKAAFAVAGSLPVASLCYLGYSAAANPLRTAKAAIKAVKATLAQTGRNVKDDAKSVPADFAASVKKLARYSGIGNPALALSDGRGEDGLRALMAELADADPGRADWLLACFAGALAETGGDRDAAAALAVEAAGGGEPGGRSLSAADGDDDGTTQGRADTDGDGLVDQRPLQLLAYVAALVQEKFAAKGKPERAAHYLDQLAELASDPDRLGELLGGVELSWSSYEGPKGGHGYRNDETGRIVYGKHKPGDRKAARAATVAERTKLAGEAQEAAKRIAAGGADPTDVEALTATIPNMTVAQLRDTRAALGAKLGTQWRDNMARKLLAHVRLRVEKARDTPDPEEPPAEPATPKAPKPGSVRTVRPDQLHVDPARFQFKLNTSNAAGVTDELKTVREWNPDFAGTLAVWHDPADGKDYVVNGHHRHDLAKRLGAKGMAVRYIDAPDAKTARAKGALINIAEGRGTAVDAAKFMRDMGLTVKDFADHGVPLKAGALADQATALAKLSDRAFDRLTRGDLDQVQALAVAKHLADHDRQDKLFGLLAKKEDEGKEYTGRAVEEMARQMAAVPATTKKVFDLFSGPDGEDVSEDTFIQRAEVAAHVRAELAKEVGDFTVLASQRRADRTADAGNVLNTGENQKRADAADQARNLYDLHANRKGRISEALDAGGVALAAAKTKKERERVRAEALDAVRAAVRAEFDAIDARTPAHRGREGGAVPGGEGPPDAGAAGAADAGGAGAVDAGLSPPPPPAAAPTPSAGPDPFAHATADHGPALDAIQPGESAWVAGHFVRRTTDGRFQIETKSAYATGTADETADRIRDTWRRGAAEQGPANLALTRAAAFTEPEWFGGGAGADEVARRKAAVPHGARAVSLDPQSRGRVGVVVRDPETGAARIQLDGSEQLATDFEPLDSSFSWRVPERERPAPAPRAETPDLFGG